jgi:hypothetical protein
MFNIVIFPDYFHPKKYSLVIDDYSIDCNATVLPDIFEACSPDVGRFPFLKAVNKFGFDNKELVDQRMAGQFIHICFKDFR